MDKQLIKAALRGNNYIVNNTTFTGKDTNTAACREILKAANLSENPTSRELSLNKALIFALISEAIDEVLPKDVTDVLGMVAEVKTYGPNEQPIFKMTTGKRRARLSIMKGARGGVYRIAQYDNKALELPVTTWTVGVYVSLEDVLLGRVSLAEYYGNVLAGFEEKICEETVAALRQAKTLAPASHIASVASADVNTKLQDLIRIAKAYGDGVTIVGFRSELEKLDNITDHQVEEDRTDIRENGIVRIYHGIPVVELPNAILSDGASVTWAFKENDLFVLPADIKPIKIAMQGDTAISEDKDHTGDLRWNAQKLMGVGLLLADNVCILTDTDNTTVGTY